MKGEMEIPAGKECGKCIVGTIDPEEEELYGCQLFNEYALFPFYMEGGKKKQVEHAQRCPACLAAYPNGATIEIKPKEA